MSRPADKEMIGRNVAGKYAVETFLGGGAMGAVYKAYQKSIEKYVAIKVLHREFSAEPSFTTRFEREAKAASLLDHVNLMRVLDYGREPDGVCYIAMELLEGRTLFQVMKEAASGTGLTPVRIAGLIRQTLAGLAVAHEMGIIHRDLKPENIVILEKFDDDGNRAELVKVCDFGMAKLVNPSPELGGPLSSEKLTSHGVVVGTPDYMSPEQGRGEPLDARSDIYSVGIILYQMLCRQLPFSAETPIATLLRHVIDEPRAPSEIDPKVHSGLESICLRSLAKKPADWFQTAREMRAEIRTVMEGRGNWLEVSGSALPPPRLALGSLPEAELHSVRREGGPRSGAVRLPAVTPPQSQRIRAVEVLRDEPPAPRRWTAPVAVVLVALLAAGTYVGVKHRRAQLAARMSPLPAAAAATAPPAASAPATGSSAEAPSDSRPALPPQVGVPPVASAEAEPAASASSGAKSAASRPSHAESHAEAPPPGAPASAPSTPLPAFGVLAVPEVPKIAGGSEPAPPSTPPPPAAAPTPFDHAKVALGAVHAEKVAAADVVAVLPVSRWNHCYQKALTARGSGVGGDGSLRLTIDSGGHIGSASFAGPGELSAIGQCIADATIGGNIAHAESATAAEVELSFHPE